MPEEGMTFKQLAPHPLYSPIIPSSLITSESAAAIFGGHLPCSAPTISLFLATSNGKLMVLAVKPKTHTNRPKFNKSLANSDPSKTNKKVEGYSHSPERAPMRSISGRLKESFFLAWQ